MTNEVRLIDANALKEEMKDWLALPNRDNDARDVVLHLIAVIDNAPTATIDNYAFGYQDGVRKVLSELEEQGHEFGNIFGDCKPTFESTIREEQEKKEE